MVVDTEHDEGTMHHDDGNGSQSRVKFERRDFLGVGLAVFGAVATALGGGAALVHYVYMPRTEAAVVHTAQDDARQAVETQIAVDKAVAEVKEQVQLDDNSKTVERLNALSEAAQVQHTNTQRLMWERGLKPKPMPAGLKLDVGDPD